MVAEAFHCGRNLADVGARAPPKKGAGTRVSSSSGARYTARARARLGPVEEGGRDRAGDALDEASLAGAQVKVPAWIHLDLDKQK